jgi:hypothetical protein
MDNLRVHKIAGVRDAIAAAGATLLFGPSAFSVQRRGCAE